MQRPYNGNFYQGNNSAQLFYDQLSPYGHWVHNREYGYVWIPDVGRSFYPYATNGRWVMSDYGWTWISDYEWGWGPFHYGRWDYDRNYGWFWFPDDEWGPAWVTWRQGDGYLGWSPMAPGMNAGMRLRNYQEPNRWVFVREKDFGRPNIRRYYVSQRRNDEILRDSRQIDNVYTDSRRGATYVTGPDPSEVERATGRRVNRVIIRDNDRPGHRLTNNQLQIYRPRVEIDKEPGNRPAPPRISDIKDIRPMRERDRRYQPEMRELPAENQPDYGQGGRDEQVSPESRERRRDVDREIKQRQIERQRRQQEIDLEKNERQNDGRRETEIRREQVERRGTREQNTGQEKKVMERERKTREVEMTDTARMKKTQHEQVRSTRRR